MTILPVKSPWDITIIARGVPLVLLVVAVHGGCCKIFGIWNNRLLGDPFWNLVCVLLGWVPNISSSLWPAIFLDMSLIATLVTSHIWLDRWPSSRSTTISTAAALEVNFLQSFVDQLLNGHNVCIWKWRLVLRLIFARNRLPLLWINKIAVFTRSLFYKGLVCDEILWWYDIFFTREVS